VQEAKETLVGELYSPEFANSGIPNGMIFIRKQHGNHNPNEDMQPADFGAAYHVLMNFVASFPYPKSAHRHITYLMRRIVGGKSGFMLVQDRGLARVDPREQGAPQGGCIALKLSTIFQG
jgi:hypothetical protein